MHAHHVALSLGFAPSGFGLGSSHHSVFSFLGLASVGLVDRIVSLSPGFGLRPSPGPSLLRRCTTATVTGTNTL